MKLKKNLTLILFLDVTPLHSISFTSFVVLFNFEGDIAFTIVFLPRAIYKLSSTVKRGL